MSNVTDGDVYVFCPYDVHTYTKIFCSENYNTVVYAILSINIALTATAVAGRMVSQRLAKATLAIDDYLCYFAFVSLFAHMW
jgi:hypothetical protein